MTQVATTAIADAHERSIVRVRGRVVAIQIEPRDAAPRLTLRVEDATGRMDAIFIGRRTIPGLEPGAVVDLEGRVCASDALPLLYNPTYELLTPA